MQLHRDNYSFLVAWFKKVFMKIIATESRFKI